MPAILGADKSQFCCFVTVEAAVANKTGTVYMVVTTTTSSNDTKDWEQLLLLLLHFVCASVSVA